MNPVSIRLLGQQLICPQFTSPHDVVAWMGAMQGQEYKMMRWAVAMRTRKPSARAFEKEYDSGKIIRTHLFRSTWHLISGDDYRWMIDLCSDKARKGVRGWIKMNGLTISEDEEWRFQEFLSGSMKGLGSLTRDEVLGIAMDSPFRDRPEHVKYLIILAEVSGVICSGDLTGNERTYCLAADKLQGQISMNREESLTELARRYFLSHGPATLEDFVWWTGLNIGECRQGVESLGDDLIQERWKGLDFLMHKDCRTRGFRTGTVTLLPSYDEYLIGYKSRQLVLHPEHRHRAHDQKGIFWPVVLQDGEVVGNWKMTGDRITTEIFNGSANLDEDTLNKQVLRYNHFRPDTRKETRQGTVGHNG